MSEKNTPIIGRKTRFHDVLLEALKVGARNPLGFAIAGIISLIALAYALLSDADQYVKLTAIIFIGCLIIAVIIMKYRIILVMININKFDPKELFWDDR